MEILQWFISVFEKKKHLEFGHNGKPNVIYVARTQNLKEYRVLLDTQKHGSQKSTSV